MKDNEVRNSTSLISNIQLITQRTQLRKRFLTYNRHETSMHKTEKITAESKSKKEWKMYRCHWNRAKPAKDYLIPSHLGTTPAHLQQHTIYGVAWYLYTISRSVLVRDVLGCLQFSYELLTLHNGGDTLRGNGTIFQMWNHIAS